MRARLLVTLAALVLWPAAASAVVTVRVERKFVTLTGADQVVPFEIYATTTDPGENERLNAFTIAIHAVTDTGNPNRPRFVTPPADPATGAIAYPPSTVHAYVFEAYPGNGPVDPANLSDEDDAFFSAALGGTGQEVDITTLRNGFGMVNVLIPGRWAPSVYDIVVDPGFLSLGGAGAGITAVPGPAGGIDIFPEPTGLARLAPLGVLALRRRA